MGEMDRLRKPQQLQSLSSKQGAALRFAAVITAALLDLRDRRAG